MTVCKLRSVVFAFLGISVFADMNVSRTCAQAPAAQRSAPNTAPATATTDDSATKAQGKKLVLKGGNYQLVREYQRNGDRVKYFSAERGAWEEIPASMVDWDATAKADAAAAASNDALLKKVRQQEEQQRKEMPLEVDASLPVAPGIFLPPGEGMFVVEGKSVTPLAQAEAQIKTDKKQRLKQVLSPIPIVQGKRNVELTGGKAIRRINSERPEFYLREAPPDPDRVSPIQTSSRPGEIGPEIELVRLKVKGDKREIESIRSMFGQQLSEERNAVAMQRWDVAKDVFRFTLGEGLPAGEYAFVQILPDAINLYVWDFGVDRKSAGTASSKN